MLGVFDSGAGGMLTVRFLRRLAPRADICFLADRKNAPYGTRSDEEIISLATEKIWRLMRLGADKVLIACCTASSLHARLPRDAREISIPIIEPSARVASITSHSGKIGVIATEATVRSGSFGKRIRSLRQGTSVLEVAASPLVGMIENGARDENITSSEKEMIRRMLSPFREQNTDTLILGCTHFPHLEKTFSELLPGVRIISSSKEGAALAARYARIGQGKTVYTE